MSGKGGSACLGSAGTLVPHSAAWTKLFTPAKQVFSLTRQPEGAWTALARNEGAPAVVKPEKPGLSFAGGEGIFRPRGLRPWRNWQTRQT